ncbi:MAG TPA: hypothetical protein P5555_00340 [Candidatus Paceibacterota bacterium]|nr:hypothetical protein [Verrucomicrobiota bacterium]HRZ43619.1 hypothetical protein [Candidatus Paceibacterota bacterium]
MFQYSPVNAGKAQNQTFAKHFGAENLLTSAGSSRLREQVEKPADLQEG